MKVSGNGVALVKRFEGFRSRPYRDAVGVWTIGYGETRGVGPGTSPWSERYAAQRLEERLNRDFGSHVNALGLPLNQNQHDALTSFVYNVGPGGIAASTGVGRALRAHQWRAAADHLLDWDKAGGARLPGLTRRRQEERALFLKAAPNRRLAGLRARYRRVKAAILKRQKAGEPSPGQRRLLRRIREAISKEKRG